MKYIPSSQQYTEAIMRQYGVNSLMAKVIEAKKLNKADFIKITNPRLVYHDFDEFSEAELVIDRIQEAIEDHEKICIYGDYDCDGMLATAILVQAFKELGVEVGYHIPNRFEDGYGLNVSRVEQMAEKGYTLIITVDNGIKAFDAVKRANELGVDVIITDHHGLDENGDLPDACSIIHTAVSIDYPFKDICGGFIAYKLAAKLLGHHDKYLYALAAVTTISDMMPLIDENRSVVVHGLRFMREGQYPQLSLLMGDNQDYSVSTIGYSIAPKINSFGRLPEYVNPNNVVRYFLKDAPQQLLTQLSSKAIEINNTRQSMTRSQYQLALEQPHDEFLYYGDESLHEGIIGLIAGRYSHEFYRPAFVMHYDEDKHLYKGSARGVQGFSIKDFFVENSDLLENYGGHELAGGFSVSRRHYSQLERRIKHAITNKSFEETKTVIEITPDDLSIDSVESLNLLAPFGQGNEAPVFKIDDIHVDQLRQLSGGKHLRIDCSGDNVRFAALYFAHGDLYDELNKQKALT
ncbi:MAG: DHH family phosphoesterase, partial [Erysipelotrichaceae bacterium]|nr:DHH family phosphoesterase [Erysipelotrichaceae bacterium]